MTKLHISDCWVKCCEDAIQIHGGYGYMTEYEVERELRDAIGSKLYSGTSEIQRNIIASMLAGACESQVRHDVPSDCDDTEIAESSVQERARP